MWGGARRSSGEFQQSEELQDGSCKVNLMANKVLSCGQQIV